MLVDIYFSFPQYTFLNDINSSISAALTSRYSETSVRGVMSDIHILSLCDYLVCTFSSQVSIFNPFLTSRLVHPYHLDESISSFRGSWWTSLLYFLKKLR